jgi:hypothetical protein
MRLLYGRVGRLTALFGDFRPGQWRLPGCSWRTVPIGLGRIREKDAELAFSTTIHSPYKHHTTSIEPSKDGSSCSVKVSGEKDAELAQKLRQLQPFMAVIQRNVWNHLHLLGQPNTFLAIVTLESKAPTLF